MPIPRSVLLVKLTEAAVGLSKKPDLEQSSSFIFKGDRLTTFNGNIMVRTKSPLSFDAVVSASDMLGMLSKIPDDEVEISCNESELRIRSTDNRRKAGITMAVGIHSPITDIPMPAKESWSGIKEGVSEALQQAARVCTNDETQSLTSCVHITPKMIEACDNLRLLRTTINTGFSEDVLLPAESLIAIRDIEITKVSMGKGWVHFKTAAGAVVSLASNNETYHDGLDEILALDKPEKITLPANLKEILDRALVMSSAKEDARIGVKIADGELTVTSFKEGAWYKEKRKVKYAGRVLDFDIDPDFLSQVLERTRDVKVDQKRMKIVVDKTQFVVELNAKQKDED